MVIVNNKLFESLVAALQCHRGSDLSSVQHMGLENLMVVLQVMVSNLRNSTL